MPTKPRKNIVMIQSDYVTVTNMYRILLIKHVLIFYSSDSNEKRANKLFSQFFLVICE